MPEEAERTTLWADKQGSPLTHLLFSLKSGKRNVKKSLMDHNRRPHSGRFSHAQSAPAHGGNSEKCSHTGEKGTTLIHRERTERVEVLLQRCSE